jgi:serine phosphatase RsbU (regulator of sigma subunit)
VSHRSAAYTSEFHYEFASQTAKLLRRRFLWFTAIVGGLGLVGLALLVALVLSQMASEGMEPDEIGSWRILIAVGIASTLVYIGAFLYALTTKIEGRKILRLAIGIVAVDGLLNLLMRVVDAPPPAGLPGFMISFTIASAFLPWTVRQALIPAAIVLGVNAVLRLTPVESGAWPRSIGPFVGVLLSVVTVIPGLLVSWWRHSSRLRDSQFYFMQRRYGEVRRELTDARRIHESMFPAPRTEGEVRFTYRYQPMRQIGGDYLHVAVSPTDCGSGERLCVVMLDVTGHGIPAALNVNRLYGELARIFGEDPCVKPGDVLRLLNRYVGLTMSRHSVYVTGLALRVDPVRGVLEYANAGHPPAFHIGVDGTLDRLDSTTFLLGAVDDATFEPHTRELRFAPGDRLVAYTDGATEAMDAAGRMLGIAGMQRMLAGRGVTAAGDLPAGILTAIDKHREGPPADDTLVVEVFVPVGVAPRRHAPRVQGTALSP